MKKAVSVVLVVLVMTLALVGTGHAWGGHGSAGNRGFHGGGRARVFVGVGPSFYWGPYWWGYPPYWYDPPVVVQEPPVLVEPPLQYWYYCQSAGAYYPSVQTCAEEWFRVPSQQQ